MKILSISNDSDANTQIADEALSHHLRMKVFSFCPWDLAKELEDDLSYEDEPPTDWVEFYKCVVVWGDEDYFQEEGLPLAEELKKLFPRGPIFWIKETSKPLAPAFMAHPGLVELEVEKAGDTDPLQWIADQIKARLAA